jgi:hypothetical protein
VNQAAGVTVNAAAAAAAAVQPAEDDVVCRKNALDSTVLLAQACIIFIAWRPCPSADHIQAPLEFCTNECRSHSMHYASRARTTQRSRKSPADSKLRTTFTETPWHMPPVAHLAAQWSFVCAQKTL